MKRKNVLGWILIIILSSIVAALISIAAGEWWLGPVAMVGCMLFVYLLLLAIDFISQ